MHWHLAACVLQLKVEICSPCIPHVFLCGKGYASNVFFPLALCMDQLMLILVMYFFHEDHECFSSSQEGVFVTVCEAFQNHVVYSARREILCPGSLFLCKFYHVYVQVCVFFILCVEGYSKVFVDAVYGA